LCVHLFISVFGGRCASQSFIGSREKKAVQKSAVSRNPEKPHADASQQGEAGTGDGGEEQELAFPLAIVARGDLASFDPRQEAPRSAEP